MTVTKGQDLVSIVIPAYNEEKRIPGTLQKLSNFFSGTQHEILVVIDGCTDNTPKLVEEFSQNHPAVRLVSHPTRLGKGGGILLGISRARGSIIAIVDADCAVLPHDVGKMVDMASGGIDCVISSRYLPGSVIHTHQPPHRVLASRCFNAMIRLLFGLPYKDTQCGCKVLNAQAAHQVAGDILTHNYAFDVELLWRIRNMGYTTVEVPVEWRHIDGSKLDLKKVIPQMFAAVVRLKLKK